ncbi:MAG: 1-acyl-sn-glycerol-3-phosphate acyltransferase [Acidobacteria bacterium]|nr:1-acyl-sn-glycerol-3-phosphate acyltransferase [Acidobacteriota bacterium]
MVLRLLTGNDPALGRLLVSSLPEDSASESWSFAEGWGDEQATLSAPSPETVVFLPSRHTPSPEDVHRAAAAAGRWGKAALPHLILVSSSQVHEPSHRHAGMLSEDRLRTSKPANAVARRWLELEGGVAAALAPHATVLTVLRPAGLPHPGGKDLLSRLLSGPWELTLPGFNPRLQLLHPEDLAQALKTSAEARRPGIYQVVPRQVIPLREVARAGGQRRLPLPGFLHGGAAGNPSKADELSYLRYPWTASGEKLERELGFTPRHTSLETVRWFRRALAPSDGRNRGPQADPPYDPLGMDPRYIERLGRTLFRFLHDAYWRIEWQGLEHVPRQGRAVLTGIHRGHQPWDGVMALHLLARELGRYPRFLAHPTLVKHPFLAPYMTQCGGVLACKENAAWVLENDEVLGVFPEGSRGAFTRYRDAYRLQSFGRHDYVRFALRHRAPIVPFVTVGSAEIFPILGKIRWPWWQRLSEWPCFPITPTLSLLPLPSKWHTLFLTPIPIHEEHPPEGADDPRLVANLSRQVQSVLQAALDDLRSRRRAVFWGSIFEEGDASS